MNNNNQNPFPERPPLEFDIEEVLNNVTLEPNVMASFLHENYINFFGDIDDFANVGAYFSDIDCLDNSNLSLRSVSSSYVSSIISRAILYFNQHQLPAKFQPLFKPKMPNTTQAREQIMPYAERRWAGR